MKKKNLKKVTYINYKGEKTTRTCDRVSHYKNYVKVEWYNTEERMHYYEDVKYENIIKEEKEEN